MTGDELRAALARALQERAKRYPVMKTFLFEIAEATEASYDSAYRWLRGDVTVDGAVLLSLCQHLGPDFLNEILAPIGYVGAPIDSPGGIPDGLKLRQARAARDKMKRALGCLDKLLGEDEGAGS